MDPTRSFRISVCKGLTCRQGGSDEVHRAICAEIQRLGLAAQCEARRAGCWGMCHLGPNVVVRENVGRPLDPFRREDYQLMGWEEETLYSAMTPEKGPLLVREHLRSGSAVAELLHPAEPAEPAPHELLTVAPRREPR